MGKFALDHDQRNVVILGASAGGAAIAAVVAAAQGALLAAVIAGAVAALLTVEVRRSGRVTLTDTELDQLRQAELALARVTDSHAAAKELAQHAIALLGARSAVVLIEGIGDTVRVSAGPTQNEDVYGSGTRMRLLDDAGVPCGSIAVSKRADGRAYTARHERILDALAERVSTTLHQLSLLGEVAAERKTLADLISSSSDGIFSVGADMRVRLWNPAMARITGVEVERAIRRHITDSFRPTDADGAPRHGAGDPGRSGELAEAVLVRIDVGDEERWLTCSYAPLSDGGYVVVARDDTERKKIQDDKDGWIAQVSHELRTPLTPIKGFLHTLIRRDDELAGPDRQKIYEIMLREEQRLEDLVGALLRSTQLEQGGLTVSAERVDWQAVVEEQVQAFGRQDPSREITADFPDELEVITSDPALATGVLTNLLSNALKYSTPGSPIEVVVDVDRDDYVTSVIDHGPGIPRSDRERVFDKFTRLGDHLTRPQQGVGLGLHIARQSVDCLGGTIWVDGTPGGGATFRFTLPKRPSDGPRDVTDAKTAAGERTAGPRGALRPRRSRPVRP